MRSYRRTSGFTLIEVMVFSVVSLMFIGLLAQVFITATRRTEDSRLRVDIQQNALMILKKFERDIAKTSTRSLGVSDTSPYVVSMTPVETWTGEPGIQWKQVQYLWVHDQAKKTIHRETYPPKSPTYSEDLLPLRPYVPTSAEMMAVATTDSGQERILSKYVEEFSFVDRTGRRTQFQTHPLKLEMKLRRPLSTSGRFAEFTMSRWYTLRNAF